MFNSSSKPHKSKENKFLPKDYFPKRFGLRFDPPTISNILHFFFFLIKKSFGIYATKFWKVVSP